VEVACVRQGGVHRYTALLVGEPSATVRPSGARVGWLSLPSRVTAVTPLTAPELVTFHVTTVSRVAMLYVGVTLPSGLNHVPQDRLAAIGEGRHDTAGAAHDLQAPTTESLSATLSTALTPQTRARARAVADTIRTDGATEAAKLLLDGFSG
jgi:hypothetical protein